MLCTAFPASRPTEAFWRPKVITKSDEVFTFQMTSEGLLRVREDTCSFPSSLPSSQNTLQGPRAESQWECAILQTFPVWCLGAFEHCGQRYFNTIGKFNFYRTMIGRDLEKQSFCTVKGYLGTFKTAGKLIFNHNLKFSSKFRACQRCNSNKYSWYSFSVASTEQISPKDIAFKIERDLPTAEAATVYFSYCFFIFSSKMQKSSQMNCGIL